MQGEYSHIQFTIPSDVFHDDRQQALIDFFTDVLGWAKRFQNDDTLGFNGFRRGQYFVLKGGDPTQFQKDDHFGTH